MTREEEIKANVSNYGEVYDDENAEYCIEGFEDGARWADQHPSKETIRAILAYYMTKEEPYYFGDDGDEEETERCVDNIHEHFMQK